MLLIAVSFNQIRTSANGCIGTSSRTISDNELYACPQSTECASGYHLCYHSAEMENLGLTTDICANIAINDEFFAIETGYNVQKIAEKTKNQFLNFEFLSMAVCNSDMGNPLDLVYGCSNTESNNTIKRQCNALNSVIKLTNEKELNYDISNIGVFCCTDQSISGIGCRQKGEETELVQDQIYACDGKRYKGTVKAAEMKGQDIDGLLSAEEEIHLLEPNLCSDDYHICDADEADALGLTSEQCSNNPVFVDKFYGTLEGVTANNCGSSRKIYGCSSSNNNYASCILNSNIYAESLFKTDGLLCCSDKVKGKGCKYSTKEKEIIAGNVYGCSGEYNLNSVNGLINAETKGCGPYYHVCNSAKELESLQFTYEQCLNVTNNGEFYATLEGIQTDGNVCNTSLSGMWGCSSNNIVENEQCSPLNSVKDSESYADGLLCCADGGWLDVSWNNMPFMVSLRRTQDAHFCGGSILTLDGHRGNGAILTAAHCVTIDPNKNGQWVQKQKTHMTVAIGCSTTPCNSTTKDSREDYFIEDFIVHPQYGGSIPGSKYFAENDIAIIYLTKPITHPNAIDIIIESDPMSAENNGKIKLTGYMGYAGPDAQGGSDYNTLEYGFTNIMDRDECDDYFGSKVVTDADFCFKDDVATNGIIVTCSGDSGSPLLYHGKQLGIVSFGKKGCDASIPRVSTYVPSYLQWILDNCGRDCGTGEYLGCYEDWRHYEYDGETMTLSECRRECSGHKYFSLYGVDNICICEDDYDEATEGPISHSCGESYNTYSKSLYVNSGYKQIKYLPDDQLINGINLQHDPSEGQSIEIHYTVDSCRISCSQFKYFYVTKIGDCRCGNDYDSSNVDNEYKKYGLFENEFIDSIDISISCDNYLNSISFKTDEDAQYVNLSLPHGEPYPYSDWTKPQTIKLPNTANCGKVKIECANAEHDHGPAGIMFGIKYKNQYIGSSEKTIGDKTITIFENEWQDLEVTTQPAYPQIISKPPYNAKWIWTCGKNGVWDCEKGVKNIFKIDLCKLSVANSPHFSDYFIPKNKNIIYWTISILSIVINIILLYICCAKSSTDYTKVKRVQFDVSDETDDENEV